MLYSAEDRPLTGHILGIRDMVSFGGDGVESLEKNFKGAVDEYLAFQSWSARMRPASNGKSIIQSRHECGDCNAALAA